MRPVFRALQGLRFFAAASVVCYHYLSIPVARGLALQFARNAVLAGPVAVGFFYILSGFVLAHAYRDRFPQSERERESFWFARFARLYPAYLLAFLLFAPMAYAKYIRLPLAIHDGPRTFLLGGFLSIFCLQAWTPFALAWNGPAWSLSVETFFYIIFPFIAKILLRTSSVTVALIVFGGWMSMVGITLGHIGGLIPNAIWTNWISYNPLFWLPLFIGGIALSRWQRCWSHMHALPASIVAYTCLLGLLLIAGISDAQGREYIVYGGAAPLLALIVLAFSHNTSSAVTHLSSNPLFRAGAVSYNVYILQAPLWHITTFVFELLSRHILGYPLLTLRFVLYFALLLVISFAVERYIEQPGHRFIMARRMHVTS